VLEKIKQINRTLDCNHISNTSALYLTKKIKEQTELCLRSASPKSGIIKPKNTRLNHNRSNFSIGNLYQYEENKHENLASFLSTGLQQRGFQIMAEQG
jgi:hypothetical protein